MSVVHFLKICGCALVLSSLADAAPKKPASTEKPAPVSAESAATLVVFNQNDRDSVELARFYAEKRGVPKEQVIGLKCAKIEEISREDYDKTIAEPLRRVFTEKGWWKLRAPESPMGPVESNKIRFVALIRGIPLKIAAMPLYEGDKLAGPAPVGSANEAAVDAEVAVLGYRTRVISGAMNNFYFRSYTPIAEARRAELMLVCRLDAPTPETVRRMITDSIAAEQEGLAGFAYIDARGVSDPGYVIGDDWLFAIANTARRRGTPTVLDNGPGIFPQSYPMTKAALYFGWYAGDLSGPFVRPEFRFVRGAVAVHIHSFSAATLRDPLRNWSGPLVSAGAAATLGNVYEPYLGLTPQLDIFHDRLRAGLTFAESAYMAQRVLSWMTTCVGDPLYRPFKGAAELGEKPVEGEWADYRQSARAWYSSERAAGDAALRAAAKKNRSGMTLEGLGLLQLSVDDRTAALETFAEARALYGPTVDALRVAVHEVMQLKAAGREAEARVLVRRVTAKAPDMPAADLLRLLVEPPPPPPATPAPAATPAKR
jgi:uncharacterized protein (TIGR03790 family)